MKIFDYLNGKDVYVEYEKGRLDGLHVVGTCNLHHPCKSFKQGLCNNEKSDFHAQDQIFPHDSCKLWEPKE